MLRWHFVATQSHRVLVESLNKDEFNNDAAGGVRTDHSFFSLWVSLAGLAQLSFLLVYFPGSWVPSENQTKTRSQHDIPSAVKPEKRRGTANSFSLQGFPVLPFPFDPQTHTTKRLPPQISLPSSSLTPSTPPLLLYLLSTLPPLVCSLLIAEVCCRDRDQSMEWFTGRPYCFTAPLTGLPDPDSHRDVSPGWLLDWLTNLTLAFI